MKETTIVTMSYILYRYLSNNSESTIDEITTEVQEKLSSAVKAGHAIDVKLDSTEDLEMELTYLTSIRVLQIINSNPLTLLVKDNNVIDGAVDFYEKQHSDLIKIYETL
jgi:hypothetical protein